MDMEITETEMEAKVQAKRDEDGIDKEKEK